MICVIYRTCPVKGQASGEGVSHLEKERDGGLAQIRTPFIYRLFNILFAAVFGAILLTAVFFNDNSYQVFAWPWLIAAVVVGSVVALLASRLFLLLPTPSRLAERISFAVLMVVLLAAQVAAGLLLQVQDATHWDFGQVFLHASNYVNTGALPEGFLNHTIGNYGLYTLFVGVFSLLKLVGVQQYEWAVLVLNCLALTGSAILLYACARRMFGVKRALFVLLCFCVILPFYAFVPLFSAELLCMPFVLAVVWLWMKARASWRAGKVRNAVIVFCILSFLAALGALLRFTVLIVWLAVVLDLLFVLIGGKRLLMLLAGAAITWGLYVGGVVALHHSPVVPAYDANDRMPLSYWVMIGLQENGTFHEEEDYQLMLQATGVEARAQLAQMEITGRLADRGFAGTVVHLADKMGYTFGDGSYGSAERPDRGPVAQNILDTLMIRSGASFGGYAYVVFALEAALLLWAVVGACKAFGRGNTALNFLRVVWFGLALFLLVWETSPRALLAFVPLLVLCAAESAPLPRLRLMKQKAQNDAAAFELEHHPLGWQATALTADATDGQPPIEEILPQTQSFNIYANAEQSSAAREKAMRPPVFDATQQTALDSAVTAEVGMAADQAWPAEIPAEQAQLVQEEWEAADGTAFEPPVDTNAAEWDAVQWQQEEAQTQIGDALHAEEWESAAVISAGEEAADQPALALQGVDGTNSAEAMPSAVQNEGQTSAAPGMYADEWTQQPDAEAQPLDVWQAPDALAPEDGEISLNLQGIQVEYLPDAMPQDERQTMPVIDTAFSGSAQSDWQEEETMATTAEAAEGEWQWDEEQGWIFRTMRDKEQPSE